MSVPTIRGLKERAAARRFERHSTNARKRAATGTRASLKKTTMIRWLRDLPLRELTAVYKAARKHFDKP